MLNNLSIKFKLLLSFGSIFVVSIIITSFLNYSSSKEIISDLTVKELDQVIFMSYDRIYENLDASIKNYLRGIAESLKKDIDSYYAQFKEGKITEEEAKKLIENAVLSKKIGKTGYIYLLDSKGVIKEHPKKDLIGKDLTKHGFIQEQIKNKEGYLEYKWKNPGEDKERDKALYMTYFKELDYVISASAYREEWDYIISASSYKEEFNSLFNIKEIRDNLLRIKIGKTGYMYIMNSKGDLIVHPKQEGTNIYQYDFIKEICNKKEGQITYIWEGREKIVSFKYIKELDYIVAAGTYTDELFEKLNKQKQTTISIIIGASIIVLIIILFLSFIISGPINKVAILLKDISEGEGDLTKRIDINSNDEIGKLSQYFNTFMEKLSGIVLDISKQSETIEQSSNDLQVASELMIKGIDEIKSKINTSSKKTNEANDKTSFISKAANEGNKGIQNVNISAKEINKNFNSIDNDAQSLGDMISSVSSALEQMGSTINEITKSTSQAAEISNKAYKHATETEEVITKLNEMALEIGNIVSIIKDIASQTNLLSLNATIEAASAGEAGTGFAVVANEVKYLSKQTEEATLKITQQIKNIQNFTQTSVVSIKEISTIITSLNEINTNIATALEEQTATINEVTNGMQQTNTITKNTISNISNISQKLSEVAYNIEKVSENINITSKNTEDTSVNIKDVNKNMDEIYSYSDYNLTEAKKVESLSSDLLTLSVKLKSIVNKFKI